MKIRSIKLENHPILGNLNLNFTNNQGQCINTIIFAGENGAGKTTILDLIFDVTTIRLDRQNLRNEKRIIEVELLPEEIEIISNNQNHKHYFEKGVESNICKLVYDYSIDNWNQLKFEFIQEGSVKSASGNVLNESDIKKIFRSIYSEVEINYTPTEIRSVTAKNIDEDVKSSYKSGNNLATNITQLLIDIEALDSQDFAAWGRKNVGKEVDESQLDSRLKRFTNAFDFIFTQKKLLGVVNKDNTKDVLFEENDKTMSIAKLSSGEKQIVFRGGFLLKDKESTNGSIILIDEPEISLHPNWQLNILDFYKSLFINDQNEQTSQLFLATHSPFIIHNINRNNDKVIVLSKNTEGLISESENPEFYTWGDNELIKEAYNVNYDLPSDKTMVFLEGETDEKYFNKAKNIFEFNDSNILFNWIGRTNSNGTVEFTGDSALNQTKNFITSSGSFIKNKVVLLYDSDTNKPEENEGNLLIRSMPQNEDNKIFEIGIENLLTLKPDFDSPQFFDTKEKKDKYGGKTTTMKLNKMKLCKWICEDLSREEEEVILRELKPIIERLINETK